MSFFLSSNLEFEKALPNFDRDYFEVLHNIVDPNTGVILKKGMLDVSKKKMPQMYIAFCKETGKAYLYNKDNENDPEWGYWREISSNLNLAKVATTGSYLDLSNTPEIDTLLANKADKSTTYTKTETNALLDDKADLVDGKVPASELPSYVDDTIEGYYYNGAFYEDSLHTTAITGERGKIYIDLTTNKSYRWTGTAYIRIDECPAFGETAGTIYEGNKGKANADAIAAIKDGTNVDSFADVETALSDKADKSTSYTKTEIDTSQESQNTRIDWLEQNIEAVRVMMNATLYGYRINKNDSNPETRVEYLYDAVGMTPARMNYTAGTFDYGSWANAWFITENKPCAVNYNGTVDYYLDPTDYTKKADGTASDLFVLLTEEPTDWATKYTEYFMKDDNDDFVFITGESAPAFAADTYYTNSAYAGNFMAQMPTVWFKRWEDTDYEYVAICNKQLNSDFKAYAHDAGDGHINPYIYLPMFKGITIDGKLRSIVGAKVEGNTTSSQEKARAEANGTGWQLWDWAKHELVSDLLTLISRSTNSQGAFGQGDTNTYVNDGSQNYGKLNTGQHKVDGIWKIYGSTQFYGESNEKHHVRVFHIEDFWGNRWDRCLGLNLVNLEYKYKMVRPYALDSDSSYVSTGLTAPQEGWQKTQYAGEFGALPKTIGGSQTTYACDFFWSSSSTRLALFGGGCGVGAYCGSRFLGLYNAASAAVWGVGGSPCFNPPHEGV